MSGTLLYRVNEYWNKALNPGVTQAVVFQSWLLFIQELVDSGRYSVVDVGTAGVSHGSSIPSSWLTWNRTTAVGSLSPAMSDNSWVVFQADYADNNLDGGGGNPWQCKIQYTMTTATTYTDPSGNNYGQNGSSHMTVIRSSASGGWTSAPTFDFPTVDPKGSNDMILCEGNDIYFRIDIVGDNDTIIWRGLGDTVSGPVYYKSRGGYLGMLSPRNTDISYPFLMTVGRISSSSGGAGNNAILGKNSSSYHFYDGGWQWPSYSIGVGDAYIDTHNHQTWQKESISYMSRYQWSTRFILPRMIVCSEDVSASDYNVLGEYRLFRATPQSIAPGNIIYSTQTGSNFKEYLSVAYLTAAGVGGIAMRWPNGIKPIW